MLQDLDIHALSIDVLRRCFMATNAIIRDEADEAIHNLREIQKYCEGAIEVIEEGTR
jgi:hypothetical protein